MNLGSLTAVQRKLIEEALVLVSTVHEEAGVNQTLRTYLMLGEATKKLEALLGETPMDHLDR